MECCLKCLALSVILGALTCTGIQYWLASKTFIFDADIVAKITTDALEASKGGDHEVVFDLVEAELRDRYGDHILPPSQKEWIFVNAGGWMGAVRVLHASTTEYLSFLGTAIDSSGHSGRFWATNISDTIISGKCTRWQEGTTRARVYETGETLYHGTGEANGMYWTAPFWAVEYGRGFIPSMMGFALSDTLFSTQDFYGMYRTLRVYTIAQVQETLQGNI